MLSALDVSMSIATSPWCPIGREHGHCHVADSLRCTVYSLLSTLCYLVSTLYSQFLSLLLYPQLYAHYPLLSSLVCSLYARYPLYSLYFLCSLYSAYGPYALYSTPYSLFSLLYSLLTTADPKMPYLQVKKSFEIGHLSNLGESREVGRSTSATCLEGEVLLH